METLTSDGLYQNAHHLSHCGKIISFDCKRDSPNDSTVSELTFRYLTFVRSDNAFVNAAEGSAVISQKTSPHLEIVTCKCALDVQKRVRTPCVLIVKNNLKRRDIFNYMLFTLNFANKLEPCFEFQLSYLIKGKVDIFHGPTVLWSHENDVHYVSLNPGGVKRIPVKLSHCVFGELPNHKRPVFVVGQNIVPVQRIPGHLIGTSTLGYFVDSEQLFDGTQIFPHPYICIIKCSRVLEADVVNGMLTCAVVAATSNHQLVYFESGVEKNLCQLPFEHAEDIQVVNTGRKGFLFVVFFRQGKVCTVWKETFQVASCWSDVNSVYVDDFLRCGTDQILLSFKVKDKNFLITDLCGIFFSGGQDNVALEKPPPQPENYTLPLRALECRLQSGLIVLQELQREVDVKDRVVHQSVQILTDLLSKRETDLTKPEQEGLVSLWDSDDMSDDRSLNEKIPESPAGSSKLQIDKLWHRITEERMVVGVMLTSDWATPLTGASLSLLTETDQSSTPVVIQARSQVFRLPASSSPTPRSSFSIPPPFASLFAEPEAKRSKEQIISDDLNADRLAVTAVTKLALLLNSGSIKCRVMLHYVLKADARRATPVVVHCGDFIVNIHDVFQSQMLNTPQLITDEVREDFLSLLTLLDRWVFHIDSPDCTLGDIAGWIQKIDGCKRIEVSPQYLLLESSGVSAPTILRWDQISPFQGELTIHSCQLHMFQFLDLLLKHFPFPCSIQPMKDTTCQKTARGFALALEKEMTSLRECLSSLLCEGQEEMNDEGRAGCEETPQTNSEEGLQRCRKAWKQDTERSKAMLSPLVDLERYRKLLQKMCEVQMDGDLASLLHNQQC